MIFVGPFQLNYSNFKMKGQKMCQDDATETKFFTKEADNNKLLKCYSKSTFQPRFTFEKFLKLIFNWVSVYLECTCKLLFKFSKVELNKASV